ncbi:DNA processing protein [Metamycoplasma subdolum]|uniref:DNA processing protein n=1 Tax=Metamycoplasma subdolum TaxID=92407 RepID=A0A3L9ZXS4_9BACT|nr:DNA-processing protein DprA [Metamycoplasma subdolum]RMA77513.1 DNA processing protein [Metamycoplasma subdolum]WPB50705.1 DNA-processing protein DprA [Metamycoplasma subdolum]
MNEYLIYFSYKYNGDWEKIYNAFRTFEKIDKLNFEKVQSETKSLLESDKYISVVDEIYPLSLQNLTKPPFIIYILGNKKLLEETECYCITGNHEQNYVLDYVKELEKVNKNFTLITTGMSSIDKKVCETLLKKGWNVIYVLASGITREWKEMCEKWKDQVLVISEYPNEYHATKKAFIARNRIIAAMAKKMILLSSKENKLNYLIENFLDLGKDVYCLGQPSEDKINQNIDLINQGAFITNDFNKVLN